MSKFAKELSKLINKLSIDSELNVPDFVIAEYLEKCLYSFEFSLKQIKSHNNTDKVSVKNNLLSEDDIKRIVIGRNNKAVIGKIKNKNLRLLSKNECNENYILKKLLDWQNNYSGIEWSEFKEKYFKCDECGSYDDDFCLCYAR